MSIPLLKLHASCVFIKQKKYEVSGDGGILPSFSVVYEDHKFDQFCSLVLERGLFS